jgi:hypothetical protein
MINQLYEIKKDELDKVNGGSGEPDVGQTPRSYQLGDPDVPAGPGEGGPA